VPQSCISMYCNLWNIRKVTSHYFSDCSSDQGTFKKAKWQLCSKCPSSYSTLKTSIASRILTSAGTLFELFLFLYFFFLPTNKRKHSRSRLLSRVIPGTLSTPQTLPDILKLQSSLRWLFLTHVSSGTCQFARTITTFHQDGFLRSL
jgi:hypothetical protein